MGKSFMETKKSHLDNQLCMNTKTITSKRFADFIRDEFAQYAIDVHKVFLFGSQVRGNARLDSDWDFLIITSEDVDRSLKRKIVGILRKHFMFEYNLDVDILVLSKEGMVSAKNDTGKMSYYAMRDGISV